MSLVHHLAFRTRDVVRLAHFYETWLGLVRVRENLPHSLWLSLGAGCMLMLEAQAEHEPEIPAGSLELFAIRVDAAGRASLRARLLAEGRLEGETAHSLYFRDPDGRRVGVSTYPFPAP